MACSAPEASSANVALSDGPKEETLRCHRRRRHRRPGRRGHAAPRRPDVQVYEQARRFARIGAGIQMMPNSMKVLRGIGIEERFRGVAFAPHSHLNRDWDTGEVSSELPMPESLYGAPYLCMHRADLHDALASVGAAEDHSSRQEAGRPRTGAPDGVTLAFADGSSRAGRCGGRRGRRPLRGARAYPRPGRRRFIKAASPTGPSFRRR